ncbi:MAG: non-canonical purine NTP pyrophosphatase, partial [Stellaceae bacterium]
RVEQELAGRDPSARFVAVLALAWPDGHLEIFRGEVEGWLTFPPRGTRGFGYDPIFVPASRSESFGEMAPESKQQMSHRAVAFAKLAACCLPPRK